MIQTLSSSGSPYRGGAYEIISLYIFFIMDNVEDERKIKPFNRYHRRLHSLDHRRVAGRRFLP